MPLFHSMKTLMIILKNRIKISLLNRIKMCPHNRIKMKPHNKIKMRPQNRIKINPPLLSNQKTKKSLNKRKPKKLKKFTK
jgi:hypothetical protein